MSSSDRIGDIERRLARLEVEFARIRQLLEAEAPAVERPSVLEPVAVRPPAPPPAPPEPPSRAPVPRGMPAAGAWEKTAASPLRRLKESRDRAPSDVLGARALAWAGGIVTVLGIVLFFALAVNRGWIGPGARVVLGACASALVFGGGLILRKRFGETHASLAAVGAGIAGAYVTLLAAGPYYDLIPDWAALALAAAIAAVGVVLSLLWSSEIVAGLGLVGALLVPVPIAWGNGVTTTGTGFVVVMFAAAAAVSVFKRWETLLSASAVVVVPQVLALAWHHHADASAGALAVAAAASAVLLGAGIGLHLRGGDEIEPFQATTMLAAAALAGFSAALLFRDQRHEGYALLSVAVVYGVASAPCFLRLKRRELGFLLCAIALAVGAIAVADILSGVSLGLVWAAEAAVLAWLAGRIRDLRVQLASLAYLVLAIGHVLLIDTPPNHLFVERVHPAAGVASLLAVSVACAVFAVRCGSGWSERRPGGVFGVVDPVLEAMRATQAGLRFVFAWLAGLGALYAVSLGLLELPGTFEWHQVAVTSLIALVSLALLVFGLLLPSRPVQLAAALGLGLAVMKNVGFDLIRLDSPQRSWTMIVIGAALLAAGFLFHRLSPDLMGLHPVAAVALAVSCVYAVAGPIDLLDGYWYNDVNRTGAAMLVPVAVYAGLCALVFRLPRLRDLSTVLWAEALAVAIVALAFLFDGTALAVAWATLAVVLARLTLQLHDERFQYGAGVCVVLAVAHAVVLDAPPTDLFESSSHPAAGAGAVAAAAVAALALAVVAVVPPKLGGSRTPLFAVAGVLATYAASLVVLELFQLGDNRVQTDFERGHAAVSAMWGLLALLLLYLGLTRRLSLRVAGFALFGITLAKIFLYDLATLSPVARALSFLAVGAVLLLGGFFYQRLSSDALHRREAAGR